MVVILCFAHFWLTIWSRWFIFYVHAFMYPRPTIIFIYNLNFERYFKNLSDRNCIGLLVLSQAHCSTLAREVREWGRKGLIWALVWEITALPLIFPITHVEYSHPPNWDLFTQSLKSLYLTSSVCSKTVGGAHNDFYVMIKGWDIP